MCISMASAVWEIYHEGAVKRLTQHKAKLSVILASRVHPSATFHVVHSVSGTIVL